MIRLFLYHGLSRGDKQSDAFEKRLNEIATRTGEHWTFQGNWNDLAEKLNMPFIASPHPTEPFAFVTHHNSFSAR